MKIFTCSHCEHPVYFTNVTCERCRSQLGYQAENDRMLARPPGAEEWQGTSDLAYCANHQHAVCNWLVNTADPGQLCVACSLNNTIPNLDDPESLAEWRRLEGAKHRLVYALYRLGLPLSTRMAGKHTPLVFDFLSEDDDGKRVLTGHAAGRITINTDEADPVHREATRIRMHERYRTLIGHFRHEVGHYYWDVLIAENPSVLARFRELFGNDEEDYQAALQRHYREGPPADWPARYISEYATTHAWEDWAETWAHYLHLMDMLETAYAFGLQTRPTVGRPAVMGGHATFDPYTEPDMDRILSVCIPITLALNELNRGMGRKDTYPFVINAPVREKLRFVHQVVFPAPHNRG